MNEITTIRALIGDDATVKETIIIEIKASRCNTVTVTFRMGDGVLYSREVYLKDLETEYSRHHLSTLMLNEALWVRSHERQRRETIERQRCENRHRF